METAKENNGFFRAEDIRAMLEMMGYKLVSELDGLVYEREGKPSFWDLSTENDYLRRQNYKLFTALLVEDTFSGKRTRKMFEINDLQFRIFKEYDKGHPMFGQTKANGSWLNRSELWQDILLEKNGNMYAKFLFRVYENEAMRLADKIKDLIDGIYYKRASIANLTFQKDNLIKKQKKLAATYLIYNDCGDECDK